MRFARVMRFFFSKKKKKNSKSLIYIYNFYFENLIYNLVKQFGNQQENNPIF